MMNKNVFLFYFWERTGAGDIKGNYFYFFSVFIHFFVGTLTETSAAFYFFVGSFVFLLYTAQFIHVFVWLNFLSSKEVRECVYVQMCLDLCLIKRRDGIKSEQLAKFAILCIDWSVQIYSDDMRFRYNLKQKKFWSLTILVFKDVAQ